MYVSLRISLWLATQSRTTRRLLTANSNNFATLLAGCAIDIFSVKNVVSIGALLEGYIDTPILSLR